MGSEIAVRGTVGGRLSGLTVWFFIESQADGGRQYVTDQIPVSNAQGTSDFTVPKAFIGADGDSGEYFTLQVVTATADATRAIRNQPPDAYGDVSFSALPRGASVIGRTVVRRS